MTRIGPTNTSSPPPAPATATVRRCAGIAALSLVVACAQPDGSRVTDAGTSLPDGGVPSTAQMVYMAPVKPGIGTRGFELVTMNLDGSNRTQITDNDELEFLPHFSPDATRLVYTRFVTGSYGDPAARTVIATYDFGSGSATTLSASQDDGDGQGVWSPDGKRIAFMRARGHAGGAIWIMSADGSGAAEVAHAAGSTDDLQWGDPAWSADDWILFVVGQTTNGCFKTRLDKIRPDGTARTKVTDGGPNCTPQGMEQSGDADPGFSADGNTIFTSRGFPQAPAGAQPPTTERKLYAVSSDAWTATKPETDLSLTSEPSCVEGVPKGSPDRLKVLLFRACFDQPGLRSGVFLTDSAGSYRTFVADGFGPDWNPR